MTAIAVTKLNRLLLSTGYFRKPEYWDCWKIWRTFWPIMMNWSSPLSPLQYCQWFTKCRLIVQLTSDWRYFNFRTAKWQAKWTTNRWMPVERRRRAELDGRNRPLQLVPRKGRRISARAGRSELRLLVRWLAATATSKRIFLYSFCFGKSASKTSNHSIGRYMGRYIGRYMGRTSIPIHPLYDAFVST